VPGPLTHPAQQKRKLLSINDRSLQKEIFMKKLWILLIIPLMLLAFYGQGYAQPNNARPSESEEGYWKLASVDIEKHQDNAEEITTLHRGDGTYLKTYPTPRGKGVFGTSYSWTEPRDRYRAGESVDLTLSIKIVEYVWFSEKPEDSSDMIIAGFGDGEILRDANHIADARVSGFNGDILDQGESRSVSGKFPPGTQGRKLSLYVYCDGAGTVSYIYEWVERPVENPDVEKQVVREGSYWELTSVDIEKCPDTRNSQYTLNRGSGTYRILDNDEAFQFSFSFTEPGKLIYAGQSVDISLNIKIDDYVWKGQFNKMGGIIEAGFLPGQPFIKSDSPAIRFAGVSAEDGQFVKRSDSVVLSGKFPPGRKNGKETFYIKTDHCAKILYHYKCTYVD
jgi:hypothetical protein